MNHNLNDNGSLSEKDVEKYSAIRYTHFKEIYRGTGVSLSQIEKVLRGFSSAKTEKAQLILKEADKVLKSMK